MQATITHFGLQVGTERTIFATWSWDQEHTDSYTTRWWYATSDGIAMLGEESSTKFTQSTYTAPTNATKVWFHVKPISQTKTVNNQETYYWTAQWSTQVTYWMDDAIQLPVPATPSVSINGYTLTATTTVSDTKNMSYIQFKIVKMTSPISIVYVKANLTAGQATCTYTVAAGAKYRVAAASWGTSTNSEYSDYSEEVSTPPSSSAGITVCRANSDTSVYLEWSSSDTATSYELQYATKSEYLDSSDMATIISGIEFTHYTKTGLESGSEYFFRVRAVNSAGNSAWSNIASVVLGKDPSAPTTWSSTTVAVVGESLTLYWMHNSEDGSKEASAELELDIDGTVSTQTITNTASEDEEDQASFYVVDTTNYADGATIKWRVRTAGVTGVYGDWSIQRKVNIYAPATLDLIVTDLSGEILQSLASFPISVHAVAGPTSQNPIGYHLSVTANSGYETTDQIGNTVTVSKGSEVYSKYFDTSDELLVELSANNIDLENNVGYTITCMVSMDSGLTAEAFTEFVVAWEDEIYTPNAEIIIDKDTLATYIQPYCKVTTDGTESLVEGVMLSVYRREYDGSFTEIATGLDNATGAFVTDPHPALDYARYRVVAISSATGAVSYYDIPGYPIGEKAAIIQWDETWTSFESDDADQLEEQPWTGSMLKLPYNIDVSNKNSPDVSLIEYIGRKHPVSYYGTQVGEAETWNVDIAKSDAQTLYALRRLAMWLGNVYVREPSGSGYWATVTVTFSRKHCEVVIPVTLEIVRVEGGM